MKAPVALRLVLAAALSLLLATPACARRDSVAVETQTLTSNLAPYWTCAVAFSSDGHGVDANEGFTFVPWFETRARERAVFEPLGREEGAEAEVTLRLVATQDEGRVNLRVLLIDTRTKVALGELEAAGTLAPPSTGDDGSEPPRLLALRGAAERILDVLEARRRVAAAGGKPAPPPPPPLPDGPGVAGSAICTTQCAPPATATSSYEEQHRVAAGIDATMKELRVCLDRVGAQLIEPAVLLRFGPDGELRHLRVDVGGYEQLACIRAIRARVPRSVSTTRASLLRCTYRCTVS